MEKLLKFDPDQRITVEEALNHPYVESYHDPEDEPTHERPFDFSFEALDKIQDMKKAIAQEVINFKRGPQTPTLSTLASRQPGRGSLSGPSRDTMKSQDMDMEEVFDEKAPMDVDEELQMLEKHSQK